MADEGIPLAENRSMLKDFIGTVATMSGDLSNITAPPFVLDTKSVIEIPSFWAEDPAIFVSPVSSEDPIQRALLVLRSFLSGLRSQCYMGHAPEDGVKKPLNAFLGELFIGKWEDDHGTTHMLSEQVSHHPPITACRVWNDKYGVIAEGYNRQTITFNGSVNVECSGHILKSLTKYDEHYLMPIPDFKVKGVLGTPYPELSGTYYIPSTSGYCSVVHFSGKSFFSSSSKKHTFTAHLFNEQQGGESKPLFTIDGHWDTEFTIRDNSKDKDIEVFKVSDQAAKKTPQLMLDPLDQQDPWESRHAWRDTVAALKKGSMQGVNDAKNRLEQGQREMREDEEKRGETWKPLFFKHANNDKVIEHLNTKVPDEDFRKSKAVTEGIWQFDAEAWNTVKKPYHGSLRPDNTTVEGAQQSQVDSNQSSENKQTEDAVPSTAQSQQQPRHPGPGEIDHRIGAVEDGRRAEVNGTLVDVGRQPEPKAIEGITKEQPAPQTAQMDVVNEQRGSGIDGMGIEEKEQIENMLRDQYSTASKAKRSARAKRHSTDKA